MLGSLTLLLALPHHGQAGGVTVADSLLLSLLDGLNLVMLGETRGFNRLADIVSVVRATSWHRASSGPARMTFDFYHLLYC